MRQSVTRDLCWQFPVAVATVRYLFYIITFFQLFSHFDITTILNSFKMATDANTHALDINIRTTPVFVNFPWLNGIVLGDGPLVNLVAQAGERQHIRDDYAGILSVSTRCFPSK